MGKKDKKKGAGAAKTAAKTEKKGNLKLKKELVAKGEEDFDSLLAKFAAEDAALNVVKEEVVSPPSRRSCFTLIPHPTQDQLILFGGEYFNGSKTFMYNDLFFYHIKHDRWIQVLTPNSPPPRSGHQAVALGRGGGQLWVFGGEFSSVNQSHFYHFKDLWVFHLSENKWEKVT
ncbi:Kelch domain-containing protein 4 [Chionoecetes opilio]|uniref:Kelch domain-containing protein 4 n=1 Tax=Chionoecetes opilio TaxID=41210 RepID=A0A8J4Y2Q0_CHIOP|nr:Kelch domain-containing protein 4 [Chionoecetes opilio]